MSDVTQNHEEKETLSVDVIIPGHAPRVTTKLFTESKKALLERDGARCWICGRTAEESGHPLESHHHPIERSLAEMIDWDRFKADCIAGLWGEPARNFNWDKFDPTDPYTFVDDQTVNGRILCKAHHTGKDEGIHDMPYPLWICQKYGREGYKFSEVEIIHHES